jgi:hypothetical protein
MKMFAKRCYWLAAIIFLLFPLIAVGEEQEQDNNVLTYLQINAPVICIDQITDDELIINDTTYWRFDGTVYYDIDGNRTSSSRFTVGTCVKIRSDENHRLLALYEAIDEENDSAAGPHGVRTQDQISASEQQTIAPVSPKKKQQQEKAIRKEGGVWKN